MRKGRLTLRGALALFCCLGLFASAGTPHALALSIEEETRMGQEFLHGARNYFQLLDDPFAHQYINDIGQFLLSPLETKPFPFRFYIIKDNTLNAFAAPGGHIFVFSGLIEAVDEVDELAAVICHEIGHISARHLANRIAQSKKVGLATLAGVLAGMLLGGEAAGALATGAMAAGIQAQLHFSREDERQADQLSYKYMMPSTFDPRAMIEALRKIERGSSWIGSDKVPAYLLTHPTGPERMANLEAMLRDYEPVPPNAQAQRFRSLFPAFKAVVRGKCLDPQSSKRLFARQLEKDPSDPWPRFGMGLAYMEEFRYGEAIQELKKALAQSPRFIPILRELGEAYLLNGQGKEAVTILKEAVDFQHDDKAVLFTLGKAYQATGQDQEALRIFLRLSYLEPVRDDVHYQLGLSYGREGKLGLAHYHFGVYFKRIGQMQKARFHFDKARDLSGKDPALTARIQKEVEEMERSR